MFSSPELSSTPLCECRHKTSPELSKTEAAVWAPLISKALSHHCCSCRSFHLDGRYRWFSKHCDLCPHFLHPSYIIPTISVGDSSSWWSTFVLSTTTNFGEGCISTALCARSLFTSKLLRWLPIRLQEKMFLMSMATAVCVERRTSIIACTLAADPLSSRMEMWGVATENAFIGRTPVVFARCVFDVQTVICRR